MPLFSSERERRLWGFALAVVVAIYSTLGLAATLAEEVRSRARIDVVFVVGFLLVLATIASEGLRRRPRGIEIVVVLGIAAVCLMIFVRMAIPVAERTHLIEYGVLSIFIYEALAERARSGGRVYVPAVLAILLTTTLGIIDEYIQLLLPHRIFDPRDILFNFLAGFMAITASKVLSWVRQGLESIRA